MRTSLFRLLPCLFVLLSTLATGAQTPDGQPFTLKQIGPNVWAAINNPVSKAQGGSNSGFVIGDDGVVVVDTFVNVEAANQLLAEIRKLTKLPVKFAINTHYHFDHVVGNRVFIDAGAAVVAQHNVRAWIRSENLKLLGDSANPQLKAVIESLAAPTVGYEQAITLYLGSREIQVRSYPGHTGGDSIVLIPDAKTIFGGDLLWKNSLPNTIDATVKSWIPTLETLAKTGAGYTFVPGHGDLANAQDVTVFRDYLATLQKLVADARAGGKSGEAVTAAVMPGLKDKYGQLEYFTYLAPRNIAEMDAELSGKKRIPRVEPVIH